MTPQEQPDSQYRNKKTGTIYAAVSFNDTPIAEVTTNAGAVFAVRADNLEKVVPDSHKVNETTHPVDITNQQVNKTDSQAPHKFSVPKRGIYKETLTVNGQVVDERIVEKDMPDSQDGDELHPVGGYLLEMLGDYHRHLCVSCDGAKDGCINCRKTGYDQTPCRICDKDGIAFRNRREFLDKVEAYAERLATERAIEAYKNTHDCRIKVSEKHIGMEMTPDIYALNNIRRLSATITKEAKS